jgi:Ca2+/H+ antiporter
VEIVLATNLVMGRRCFTRTVVVFSPGFELETSFLLTVYVQGVIPEEKRRKKSISRCGSVIITRFYIEYLFLHITATDCNCQQKKPTETVTSTKKHSKRQDNRAR